MIPYFIVFIIVTILIIISQNAYKKSKKLSSFIALICILILGIFAGLRSYNVGTDIKVYGLKYFEWIRSYSNIFEYVSRVTLNNNVEKMYLIFNYLIYKIVPDYHFFLFSIEVVISTFIFRIAYKEKNNGAFYLYILSFLFLWYNSSFNILRQSLAIVIILIAYHFIEEKKYLKFEICVLIAALFHKSAIICAIMPIIDIFSHKKNGRIYIFIIALLSASFVFFTGTISNIITSYLPSLSKYTNYLISDRVANTSKTFTAYKLIMLITIYFFHKKSGAKDNTKTLMSFALMDFIFYIANYAVVYSYRLSYYFLPFYILLIPRIGKNLSTNDKKYYNFIIIIILALYWITRFVIGQYDGTLPYEFFWQNV